MVGGIPNLLDVIYIASLYFDKPITMRTNKSLDCRMYLESKA